MLRNLFLTILFLLAATTLAASDSTPTAATAFAGAEVASELPPTGSDSVFVTNVLSPAAACDRPQATAFDPGPPGSCSDICGQARCGFAWPGAPCGPPGSGKVCIAGPICSGQRLACTCAVP